VKEIIEYILASLIIISIIPIYDYIIGNLYNPPELTVDYSLLNLFTLHVTNILNKPFIHGNASSPLFSFEKLVESKLGYLLTEYRYRVEVISASLLKVFFNNTSNDIIVETLEPGYVNILVVYRDNERIYFKNITLTQYILKTINNTYIYSINISSIGITSPDKLLYILAILETPGHRYINYYALFENNVRRVYFGENNENIAIIAPKNLLNTQQLNATIVFYNQGEFYCLNESSYEEPRKITGNNIEFYRVYMRYVTSLNKTVIYNNIEYSVYNLTLYVQEKITRVRIRPDYEEIEVSTDEHRINVYSPIYNLVLAVLYDNVGNIYVAEWYPHRLVFGYDNPGEIPVSYMTTVVRLGMIDYVVVISMWRSYL